MSAAPDLRTRYLGLELRSPIVASASPLNDQLDRAATSSFERSFLFAALLAGSALVPIALTRVVTL